MDLLSTGTFANMCNVTKKTLYFYEKKGLLKPAVVKDNGYRYYRIEQVDQMATIRLLEILGSSLDEVGDFFQLDDLAKRSRYLQEKEDAVKGQMRQLGRIRDSLDFYQDRLQDFVNLGTGKIAEEELDEEELELIKFQHGVALTPITYGPRYGGMVGDFEKPVITSFFKVVPKGEGNCIKPSGRYLYFYEEVDNDGVASGIVPALAKLQAAGPVVAPLFQEDFSSSVLGRSGSIVIKYSARLGEEDKGGVC